jgi:aspartate aminotransferase
MSSNAAQERQIRLSKRLAQLQPSATIGLIGRIKQMRDQGHPVISFGQGEPDFPTPIPIKVAAFDAIERNYTRYTPVGGIPELRRAVAQRVEQDTGLDYTMTQVTMTDGVKEALFLSLLATCDEGDEVIIPAPYWVSYVEQVRMAGATPVVIPTSEESHFKVTPDQLREHLTPRTRVFLLSSPSNPTGTVYTADELHDLAVVLREHRHAAADDVLIFSDEIYDQICYVGYARWLRVAPDFADHTLIFNGLSKTYAMTGWRIGYVAGPEPIISAVKAMQSHSTTHPASVAQYAALAAYTPSAELEGIVAQMVRAFQERRDLMMAALEQIAGVTCVRPEGAFYVFPNISNLLNRPLAEGIVCSDGHELADYLLDRVLIGVVPGEAFGMAGYIRISYAQSSENLSEGMRRFAEAITP